MQELTPVELPREPSPELPYRRSYGRLLVVAAVVATLCLPLFRDQSSSVLDALRALLVTFGLGIALLWAPALFYAGIRTKCTTDWTIALIGMVTLLFWIPWLIFS